MLIDSCQLPVYQTPSSIDDDDITERYIAVQDTDFPSFTMSCKRQARFGKHCQ